jgi:hypothetical protein
MSAFVPFNEWKEKVSNELSSRTEPISIDDLDSIALEKAWKKGVQPLVFAWQPDLPIIRRNIWTETKSSKSFAILASILIISLVSYFAINYLRAFYSARALQSIKFPVGLPIKYEMGSFYPPDAQESAEEAKKFIKEYLMTPRDADSVSAEVVQALSYGRFKIKGVVASKNKYGTKIDSKYEMIVYRKYQTKIDYRTSRTSDWQLLSNEWFHDEPRLFATGDTNIWSRQSDIENIEASIDDGVFRQAKSAAKKTFNRNILRKQNSKSNLYNGDTSDSSQR